MKKTILVLMLILSLILSLGVSFAKEETIKIGMTTVITGDRSLEGEYGKNAAVIAVEEINNNGGVLGKKLEIIIEDLTCPPILVPVSELVEI